MEDAQKIGAGCGVKWYARCVMWAEGALEERMVVHAHLKYESKSKIKARER